jgi:hypothetical protein
MWRTPSDATDTQEQDTADFGGSDGGDFGGDFDSG